MEFRYLGRGGLKVCAASYGNWVTHGSQVEPDRATACVRAALEAGITEDALSRVQNLAPLAEAEGLALVGNASTKGRLA